MRAGLAVVALLALAAPALASTAAYSDPGSPCALQVVGQPVPQSVVACTVAQQGTATSNAEDCGPTGCGVRVAGSASGHSGLGRGIAVVSTVLYSDREARLCSASSAGADATCSGATSALFVGVLPGACAGFAIRSTATVQPSTSVAAFRSLAAHDFQLCRDARGTPTVS